MNPRLIPRAATLLRPSIATPSCQSPVFGFGSRVFTTTNSNNNTTTTTQSVKMTDRVHRITMFKLPGKDDQAKLLEQYKKLSASQQKDGKPYILSMVVGAADEDARSQGFTFVSKTEFASKEDMKYYDDDCAAHQELKGLVKTLSVEGVMTVYFKPQAVGGVDNA